MMHNLLTDIEGVAVGHATDLKLGSGVTAIVFDEPAVASGSVLGGAPGGRDTALLDPAMTVQVADAFVLSGGSAFGLDAPAGASAAAAGGGVSTAARIRPRSSRRLPPLLLLLLLLLPGSIKVCWSFSTTG